MDDTQLMILELAGKGYGCAQIMIIGGLRLMGRENPDLVRAMGGLAQGAACGEMCGALSGGTCLLALHTDKGHDNEDAEGRGKVLMEELADWFREELCQGGSVTCDAILGCLDAGPQCRNMDARRCGMLVARTWEKAVSLLVENNIDPALGRDMP